MTGPAPTIRRMKIEDYPLVYGITKKKHINPCIARRLIKENELIVS